MTDEARVYNPYSEFARIMCLPFSETGKFWKYVDQDTREMLLQSADKPTLAGSTERKTLKDRLNSYPLVGPLGSQHPKLPVSTKVLHAKLNEPASGLRESWGKKNIVSWSKTLDSQPNPYRPSNRAAATCRLVRMPGDTCLNHSRSRLFNMNKLRNLRDELRRGFVEYRGVEFGATAVIFPKEVPPVLYDIAVLNYAPPKSDVELCLMHITDMMSPPAGLAGKLHASLFQRRMYHHS